MATYRFEKIKGNSEKTVVQITKSKKKIEIFPMILCVLVAFVIWLVVYNLNDVSTTATYQLPIEITGKSELLEDRNLALYSISDTYVSVVVQGSNRDIKKHEASDYHVYADVSQIKESGEKIITLKVVMPSGSTLSYKSVEPASVTVMSDKNASRDIPIQILTGDMLIDSTYESDLECSQDFITISGPEIAISRIDYASYSINPGNVTSSLTIKGFTPVFYDIDGEIVNLSTNITYDVSKFLIKLNVTTTKKIPINVKLDDPNYAWSIEKEEDRYVTVVGDPKLLETVTDYVISNITAVTRDYKMNITSEKFPDGVSVAKADENKTVYISVYKLPDETTPESEETTADEVTSAESTDSQEETVALTNAETKETP